MTEEKNKVLINDEEQYSLWPIYLEIPGGWYETGMEGSREKCLEYVRENWKDMRPLSLRGKMEGDSAGA